jgi:hypothetical protein
MTLRRETPRRAPDCRDSALQSQDQRQQWLCSAGRSRLVFGELRTRQRTRRPNGRSCAHKGTR